MRNLQVKCDYSDRQIKLEPRGRVTDEELFQVGKDIFDLIKSSDKDDKELDELNTKLNELDQAIQDVRNQIRLHKYEQRGGDENQKDTRTFNDSFVDTKPGSDGISPNRS